MRLDLASVLGNYNGQRSFLQLISFQQIAFNQSQQENDANNSQNPHANRWEKTVFVCVRERGEKWKTREKKKQNDYPTTENIPTKSNEKPIRRCARARMCVYARVDLVLTVFDYSQLNFYS